MTHAYERGALRERGRRLGQEILDRACARGRHHWVCRQGYDFCSCGPHHCKNCGAEFR